MISIEDKIHGCVMGLAVGDAMGAPLEGSKPGAIRAIVKKISGYVDAEDLLGGKLFRWRTPGMYSDETQQALALLDTCLECRGLDTERFAAWLVKLSRGDSLLQFGALRGPGLDLRTAIEALKPGASIRHSGGTYPGGAPAARIPTLALYYADQPHALPDKIIESTIVTHRSPISVSAAAAVARLTLKMLEIESLPPGGAADLISDAAAFCREIETRFNDRYLDVIDAATGPAHLHLFSGTLEQLARRIADPPEKISEWLAANADPHANMEIKRPELDFALCSVPYAIMVFTRNADSFEAAVAEAVGRGGDADGIGAIAGALAGALLGPDAIPEEWLKGLANRKQLKARAQALCEKRFNRSALESLYEMEYALTRKEHEEREARMKKSRRVKQPEKEQKKPAQSDSAPGEKFDRKKFEKQIKKMKREDRQKYFPKG